MKKVIKEFVNDAVAMVWVGILIGGGVALGFFCSMRTVNSLILRFPEELEEVEK